MIYLILDDANQQAPIETYQKTIDFEWFYMTNKSYLYSVGRINQLSQDLQDIHNDVEKNIIITDIKILQKNCMRFVNEYNFHASITSKSILMDWYLPYELVPGYCTEEFVANLNLNLN